MTFDELTELLDHYVELTVNNCPIRAMFWCMDEMDEGREISLCVPPGYGALFPQIEWEPVEGGQSEAWSINVPADTVLVVSPDQSDMWETWPIASH